MLLTVRLKMSGKSLLKGPLEPSVEQTTLIDKKVSSSNPAFHGSNSQFEIRDCSPTIDSTEWSVITNQ